MDKEHSKDTELQRLDRDLRVEEVNLDRPSADVLARYLSGSASNEELMTVQEALIASADFRRELLSIAKELETLEQEEAESSKVVEKVRAPDFNSFVEKNQLKVPEPGTIHVAGNGVVRSNPLQRTVWQRLGDWLSDMLTPRIYVPAAVTAAVALMVVVGISTDWFGGSSTAWTEVKPVLFAKSIPPENVLFNQNRSTATTAEPTYDSTAMDADVECILLYYCVQGRPADA